MQTKLKILNFEFRTQFISTKIKKINYFFQFEFKPSVLTVYK